jgi:hypothetical protein
MGSKNHEAWFIRMSKGARFLRKTHKLDLQPLVYYIKKFGALDLICLIFSGL